MSDWLKACCSLQWRILTFRASEDELFNLGWRHVPFGLFWALLAGVGRAWDNPTANKFFHSGLPSVIYVVVLSLFLWIFISPLRPERWRFSRVCAFVSLTALPGILYAVPFEMMMSSDDAIVANGILLLIVASWRVALLTSFLWRARLSRLCTITAVCLPLSIIILGLVATDRLEKTFAVMGGFRYLVVENETLAKPYLDAQRKLPNFSAGSAAKIQTRGAKGKHTVYKEYSHSVSAGTDVPAGMRQVTWDDPEYLPPTPVIAVARALTWVSLVGAPIFGLIYAIICIRNLVNWIRQKLKERRDRKAGASDSAVGESDLQGESPR